MNEVCARLILHRFNRDNISFSDISPKRSRSRSQPTDDIGIGCFNLKHHAQEFIQGFYCSVIEPGRILFFWKVINPSGDLGRLRVLNAQPTLSHKEKDSIHYCRFTIFHCCIGVIFSSRRYTYSNFLGP